MNYNSKILNLKAMREVVKTKVQVDEDNYIITDKAGWKFKVNIKSGMIYRKVNDDWIACCCGMTSKKNNGYLYVDINFEINGEVITKAYAQHSIVAMVAHEKEFDELFNGKNMVIANHMNNCPWNNTSDNLEWTTNKWNMLHGVVIHSINKNKSSIQSYMSTERKFNKNDEHAHIVLSNGQAISVMEIEAYEKFILANNTKVKSLRKYWGIVGKDSENKQKLIKAKDLVNFLVWLENYRENSVNA